MKRILEKRGIDVQSPRETFREAARNRLIQNPENWFLFLEKRNLTSHTYKEENALAIINILPLFSKSLSELLLNLGYSK
jgi:nucleotidyltransferase substrate binding protein (TIGR01987 family)